MHDLPFSKSARVSRRPQRDDSGVSVWVKIFCTYRPPSRNVPSLPLLNLLTFPFLYLSSSLLLVLFSFYFLFFRFSKIKGCLYIFNESFEFLKNQSYESSLNCSYILNIKYKKLNKINCT